MKQIITNDIKIVCRICKTELSCIMFCSKCNQYRIGINPKTNELACYPLDEVIEGVALQEYKGATITD